MGDETVFHLAYASREAFEADFAESLRKGRAFVSGASAAAERIRCRVLVGYPGVAPLAVDGEVVWIKRDAPGEGVGVQLADAARDALRAWAVAPPPAPPASGGAPRAGDELHEQGADDAAPGRAPMLHERVRSLSTREREIMARQGTLPERVALERCYGGTVWEGLLQNPQLTPPEVAKIAKNGTLPRPLAALIVANAGWLAVGEIQRALLSNPRIGGRELERVLRALGKNELERVSAQSIYRAEVRTTAKRLLGK